MDSVMKTGEHLETTRSVQLEDENYVVPERTTNLRRRSANKKERHERSRRGRKPSRPERLLNESTEEVGVDESNQEMHLDNSVINNASHDEKHANDIDDLQQQHDDSKALQDIVDAKSILDATSLAGASMQASSVLQALGLARSVSNGVGYGINLGNNKSLTDVGNSSVMNNSQSVSTKTVPLLVNMKASAQAVPSILPANLPPGRYVIISSTTTPSTSTTQQQALTTTPTTTTQSSHSTSSSNPVVDLAAALKANQNLSASNHNSSRLSGLARNSGGGSSAAPSSHHHHHVRTPVGKTRGMRKSYTTSEKLAMIEAVESGLKKSVVADRFGVAPSTLACIILQKDKIRRDQTKTNSMGRRRIRPSSNLSRLDLAGAHGSSGYSGSSTGAASATSRDQSSPTPDQQHAAGNSSALLQRCSSLSPYSSMAASYASLSSVLSSSGFLGGIEAAAVAAAAAARPTLPFTHFLANFDQSLGYDANQPEEIVSVPDLSESMSGFGSGGNSSSTPITNFKSEDNTTVDKRAPSAQETDCGAEETMEEGVPGTLSEEEEDCNEASMTEQCDGTPGGGHLSGGAGQSIDEPNIEIQTTTEQTQQQHLLSSAQHQTLATSNLLLPSIPSNQSMPSTAAGASDGLQSSSGLTGLCLVKREVHCYSVLDQLMRDETYTDVTLTTEGQTFKAHKIVLCMASNYFKRVLSDNSPGVRNVVVLRDIAANEMKSILQFLYTGEATVDASELQAFMRTAQLLEITSLCDSVPHIPSNTVATKTDPAPQTSSSSTYEQQQIRAPLVPLLQQQQLQQHLQSQVQKQQQQQQQKLQDQQQQQKLQEQQQQVQYYIQQHIKRQLEALARQNIHQQHLQPNQQPLQEREEDSQKERIAPHDMSAATLLQNKKQDIIMASLKDDGENEVLDGKPHLSPPQSTILPLPSVPDEDDVPLSLTCNDKILPLKNVNAEVTDLTHEQKLKVSSEREEKELEDVTTIPPDKDSCQAKVYVNNVTQRQDDDATIHSKPCDEVNALKNNCLNSDDSHNTDVNHTGKQNHELTNDIDTADHLRNVKENEKRNNVSNDVDSSIIDDPGSPQVKRQKIMHAGE